MSDAAEKSEVKKAVGLLSGGLDSSLAVRIMSDMGYEVTALNIETPFCNCSSDNRCKQTRKSGLPDIQYKRAYAGQEYIDIVKNPPHGHGKNMNICIDCRIYMLKKAKIVMEEIKADVVFTGEVLGQRPMSQKGDALKLIEKESGLEGRLLRPLSARLLRPTIPEQEGRIERDRLFNFQGRSRKPQMEMAERLMITDYPTPAGGCKLTDESFARRLHDAFNRGEDSLKNISRLKYGRHFRLDNGAKIISGRTAEENRTLMALKDNATAVFTVKGYSSTYTFLFGEITELNRLFSGRVAARYSKVKNADSVEIMWWMGKNGSHNIDTFTVSPITDRELKRFRI